MLQRAVVDVLEIVERGVVIRDPVDRGKVQYAHVCTFEDRRVGVIRQQVVDRVEERRREWLLDGARGGNQLAVPAARLEQIARSRGATVFHVHDRVHFLRLCNECLRTQKAGFFAVGDEEGDWMLVLLVLRRSCDFERCRESDAVVRCTGTCPYGVVVRCDQDSRLSSTCGEDVFHRCARRTGVADECSLHLCLVAEGFEAGHDAVPHGRVRRRADPVGLLLPQDVVEDLASPGGREFARGRCGSLRVGAPQTHDEDGQDEDQRREDEGELTATH